MALIDVLCRLQDADQEWDELAKRFREVKGDLEDSSRLEGAQAAQEALDSSLAETERELARTEDEIESLRRKAAETEDALYGSRIRSPREVEGLRLGGEQIKEQISQLEDRALELMTALDELQTASADGSQALAVLSEERASERKNLASEYESLRGRLQVLRNLRADLRKQVTPAALALYEQLRERKGGVALAPMNAGRCGVCNVSIPSNKIAVARRGDAVVTCDGCGRILHAP